MVQAEIINKILNTKSFDIIADNNLDIEYFMGYEQEFTFIKEHFEQYKQIPDKTTFLSKFPEFELFEVDNSDKYLVDAVQEELAYSRMVPVLQRVESLIKNNAFDAIDYLTAELPKLTGVTSCIGVDIIQQAMLRFEEYETRRTSEEPWYIPTGFAELDNVINGWTKGEEFGVLFARTGQGKSWVLGAMLTHAWKLMNRVGLISPEMSANKFGYRFDTLLSHFSNRDLITAKDVPEYKKYIEDLTKNTNPFVIATPKDFNKKITVSKLRTFIKNNRLDILGIDGIKYLSDERYKKGDNTTTSLTNISEDLMALSLELGVPIIVVVQSNREGVRPGETDELPDLENIRDSDGIAQNATKVISLKQSGDGLHMCVKKNRDGKTGEKLCYVWHIDTGEFQYIPGENDRNAQMPTRQNDTRQKTTTNYEPPKVNENQKRKFTDGSAPF